MRAYIYIFSLLLIISSCRSIDKMVEGGRYDDAYAFAIGKLKGKKHKKTKYVKGLEKAYNMLNQEDLDRISSLSNRSSDEKWSEIFHAYDRIEVRQRLIRPLLPLVSKDGYRARILLNDYTNSKGEARNRAVVFHKALGDDYMIAAENGDKYAARMAFGQFEDAVSLDSKHST